MKHLNVYSRMRGGYAQALRAAYCKLGKIRLKSGNSTEIQWLKGSERFYKH
jgi:hypothetical protein